MSRTWLNREIGNVYPLFISTPPFLSRARWRHSAIAQRKCFEFAPSFAHRSAQETAVPSGNYQTEPLDRCFWLVDVLDKEAENPYKKESDVWKAVFSAFD